MVQGICALSGGGAAETEERRKCSPRRHASPPTREAGEPMPSGPTLSEGSDGASPERAPGSEHCESAHASSVEASPSTSTGRSANSGNRNAGGEGAARAGQKTENQHASQRNRADSFEGPAGRVPAEKKEVDSSAKRQGPGGADHAVVASSQPTAGGKRKKKEKVGARLSFSDELGADGGEGEDGNGFGSISQSTNERFLQEERKRRRQQEEDAASATLHSASTSLFSSPSSHQAATPAHAAASTPSAGATSSSSPATRRQQCVFDDDQAAWLPLGVRHQVSERQGKRPYMEDKALMESDWHHKGWHLFGIFDGHGGSRASSYVRDEIPGILRRRIVESERDMPAGVKEITEALSSSFSEVDRRFLDIARAEQLKDGTTALLGLLRNNTLHVGWVGDSRCILSRQGRYVRVSEDHKPDRPDERRAVEARGGQVIFRGTYRVAGPTALAVSRAIGDILMKEPRKLVISDPEIKTIDLLPQDEFLVMASDGLFDVMEDQSVIDTVGNHLKEHNSYRGAADKLTAMALEKGSLDNVTVVIIQLVWGADAVED